MIRRLLLVTVAVAALLLAVPVAASAHPLGNFTVNRYDGVVVSPDEVRVDHVVDIAEIPTAQRLPAIDTSGDGVMSGDELTEWARGTCRSEAVDVRLTVDGAPVDLVARSAVARRLPGQAELPILRVECDLRAEVALTGRSEVTLVDRAGDGEVGWQEVTAAGDGATLVRTDVPARSPSRRLTAYPADLLSSPLSVTSAALVVQPGGPALDATAGESAGAGVLRAPDRLTAAFEGLVGRYDGGPLVALLALLGAAALGGAHAVAPGHGKTIMAFYLSGQREAALRSAATVGATVTVTHTAGVLLLGVLVSAGTAFVPARVYPWLSVVSGALVLAVGLALLRAARRPGAFGHSHGTGPGQHTHGPGQHTHGPEPVALGNPPDPGTQPGPLGLMTAPNPAPASQQPQLCPGTAVQTESHVHPQPHTPGPAPSRGSLVAMGMAGGLVPSPSALLVFLAALGLGHPWFGTGLVVAFGIGMAATLAAVGLVVMRLRERAESRLALRPSSRLAPLLRLLPLLTAGAVTLLGVVLATRGLTGTGLF